MRLCPAAAEAMLVEERGTRLAATRSANAISQLPKDWKLDSYEHARRCLTTLAPGHWTEGHIVGLVMQATQFAHDPAAAYQPPNVPECVSVLAGAVLLPDQLLDTWPVRNKALHAACNCEELSLHPVSLSVVDSLYPAAYDKYRASQEPWGVVASPSAYVVDLQLFLLSLLAPAVLAVLVPSTYLTHAPRGRVDALRRLVAAGRVGSVKCPRPVDYYGVASVWVCVFKDAKERQVKGHGVADLELPQAESAE